MYRDKQKNKTGLVEELLQLTIGAALMGCALSIFLIPFKIAPGGMSGLATVLHYLLGINVSTLLMLINAPIFLLGFVHFSKGFLFRSVYGTIILSAFTEIFSQVSIPVDDMLLACVFGGVIMGCGIALALQSGGTTGGTDIIVLVLRKFLPNLSVGRLFMTIDGVIILIAGVTIGGWETILYSSVTLFISGYITDTILEGVKFARLVYIISDKDKEITKGIYSEMDRGVTGFTSVSMYTGKTRQALLCVIRKYELPKLKGLIYSIDPDAFVIISEAREVMGKGFDMHTKV